MGATTRRQFIGGAIQAGLAIGAMPLRVLAARSSGADEMGAGLTEDHVRDHGVLDRILLIYEESMKRLEGLGNFDPDALIETVDIVRRFIEQYHERLEEEHIFPILEKAGKLVELTSVLRKQHGAGRKVTADILRLAAKRPRPNDGRIVLRERLDKFVRMYRPHEAREDTVVFPVLHKVLSQKEFELLGERFEDEERRLFGASGIDGVVGQIAEIEESLGIYDLARFTP